MDRDALEWLKANARFGARREHKKAAVAVLEEFDRMQTALKAAAQSLERAARANIHDSQHIEVTLAKVEAVLHKE